ncbi:hypothetical protein HDU97_001785 [Phlyctochytrium planicorne]|nr:hypothetical protein HDU97_001785 [Phlyctochytrium planicorne]
MKPVQDPARTASDSGKKGSPSTLKDPDAMDPKIFEDQDDSVDGSDDGESPPTGASDNVEEEDVDEDGDEEEEYEDEDEDGDDDPDPEDISCEDDGSEQGSGSAGSSDQDDAVVSDGNNNDESEEESYEDQNEGEALTSSENGVDEEIVNGDDLAEGDVKEDGEEEDEDDNEDKEGEEEESEEEEEDEEEEENGDDEEQDEEEDGEEGEEEDESAEAEETSIVVRQRPAKDLADGEHPFSRSSALWNAEDIPNILSLGSEVSNDKPKEALAGFLKTPSQPELEECELQEITGSSETSSVVSFDMSEDPSRSATPLVPATGASSGFESSLDISSALDSSLKFIRTARPENNNVDDDSDVDAVLDAHLAQFAPSLKVGNSIDKSEQGSIRSQTVDIFDLYQRDEDGSQSDHTNNLDKSEDPAQVLATMNALKRQSLPASNQMSWLKKFIPTSWSPFKAASNESLEKSLGKEERISKPEEIEQKAEDLAQFIPVEGFDGDPKHKLTQEATLTELPIVSEPISVESEDPNKDERTQASTDAGEPSKQNVVFESLDQGDTKSRRTRDRGMTLVAGSEDQELEADAEASGEQQEIQSNKETVVNSAVLESEKSVEGHSIESKDASECDKDSFKTPAMSEESTSSFFSLDEMIGSYSGENLSSSQNDSLLKSSKRRSDSFVDLRKGYFSKIPSAIFRKFGSDERLARSKENSANNSTEKLVLMPKPVLDALSLSSETRTEYSRVDKVTKAVKESGLGAIPEEAVLDSNVEALPRAGHVRLLVSAYQQLEALERDMDKSLLPSLQNMYAESKEKDLENSRLQSEISLLKGSPKQAESQELSSLRLRNAELEECLQRLKDDMKIVTNSAESNRQCLSTALKDMREQNAALASEKEKYRIELQEFAKEREMLKSSVDKLQEEKGHITEKLSNETARAERLEEEVSTCKISLAEISELKKHLEAMTEAFSVAKQESEKNENALKEEIAKAREEFEQSSVQEILLEEARKEANDLRGRLEVAEENSKTLRTLHEHEVTSLNQQIRQMKEELQTAGVANKASATSLEQTELELANLRKTFADETAKMKTELTTLVSQDASRLCALEAENKELKAKCLNAEETERRLISTFEVETLAFQKQIAALTEEFSKLNAFTIRNSESAAEESDLISSSQSKEEKTDDNLSPSTETEEEISRDLTNNIDTRANEANETAQRCLATVESLNVPSQLTLEDYVSAIQGSASVASGEERDQQITSSSPSVQEENAELWARLKEVEEALSNVDAERTAAENEAWKVFSAFTEERDSLMTALKELRQHLGISETTDESPSNILESTRPSETLRDNQEHQNTLETPVIVIGSRELSNQTPTPLASSEPILALSPSRKPQTQIQQTAQIQALEKTLSTTAQDLLATASELEITRLKFDLSESGRKATLLAQDDRYKALLEKYEKCRQEVLHMEVKVSAIEIELREARESESRLQTRFENLEKERNGERAVISDLRQHLAEAEAEACRVSLKIESLQNEKDSLQQHIAILKQHFVQVEAAAKEVRDRLLQIESELLVKDNEICKAKEASERAEKKAKLLESNLSEEKFKFEELRAKGRDSVNILDQVRKQLDSVTENYAESLANLSKAKDEHQNLRTQILEHEKTIAKMIEELSSSKSQQNDEYVSEIVLERALRDALAIEHKDALEKFEGAQEEVLILKEALNARLGEITELRDEIQQKDEKLFGLQKLDKEASEAANEVLKLKKSARNLSAEKDNLHETLSQTQLALENERTIAQLAKQDVDRLESALNDSKKKYKNLEASFKNVEDILRSEREARESVEKSLSALKSEGVGLRQKITKLEGQLQKAVNELETRASSLASTKPGEQSDLEKLQAKCNELENALSDAGSNLAKVTMAKLTLEAEMGGRDARENSLKEEIGQLRRQLSRVGELERVIEKRLETQRADGDSITKQEIVSPELSAMRRISNGSGMLMTQSPEAVSLENSPRATRKARGFSIGPWVLYQKGNLRSASQTEIMPSPKKQNRLSATISGGLAGAIAPRAASIAHDDSYDMKDKVVALETLVSRFEETSRQANAEAAFATDCLLSVASFLGIREPVEELPKTISPSFTMTLQRLPPPPPPKSRAEKLTELIHQKINSQKGRVLELETLVKERDDFIHEILQAGRKVWEERQESANEVGKMETLIRRLQNIIEDSASVVGRRKLHRLVTSTLGPARSQSLSE